MTTYARLTESQTSVETWVELTADQYAALQGNGKASWLRLWVEDAKPTPGPTQAVSAGHITITQTEARQTWVLRDKTERELAAEQNAADRPTLVQLIAAITTDIDAYNANPDVSGTAVERLTKLEARVKDLERQQRRDNRVLRHYLRSLL